MRINIVASMERKSVKLIDDLANRHGSVAEVNGIYCAPKEDCKEILKLPNFDKWKEIFIDEEKFLRKTGRLYHLLGYVDNCYKEKNDSELTKALQELSEYLKENLAAIRLYTDFFFNKPVLAIYSFSFHKALYLIVNRPDHKVLLDEVTKNGLHRIKPTEIIDVWFIGWIW